MFGRLLVATFHEGNQLKTKINLVKGTILGLDFGGEGGEGGCQVVRGSQLKRFVLCGRLGGGELPPESWGATVFKRLLLATFHEGSQLRTETGLVKGTILGGDYKKAERCGGGYQGSGTVNLKRLWYGGAGWGGGIEKGMGEGRRRGGGAGVSKINLPNYYSWTATQYIFHHLAELSDTVKR